MKLSYQPYSLIFKHPFGVSGNTRTQTPTVFVRLEENGEYGYGEACLPPYLGETIEGTITFLELAKKHLVKFETTHSPQKILSVINQLAQGNNAAKAAIDIALNDLVSKKAGQSFASWKDLTIKHAMPTSFTIGIDSEEKLIQKIKEAEDYQILKIKAGTGNDKALISFIRQHTSKPMYVDVNQGWTNKYEALEMANWLHDKNVIVLEQPMPKDMQEEMAWLTKQCPILTVADESVKRLSDLQTMHGAFGGINLKLMKCTGLNEALEMIAFCKQNGLKILLGCMAESSCGISAMAQLMAYADFIDLDSPQLYTNDPFTGLTYEKGNLMLPIGNGIGTLPGEALIFEK
jgi:L-Ala-D/L-Glu epimerase